MMLYPLLHYENEKIWLDGDVLKNLYRVATERVDKMERDVYAMIGGQINLNSPVQVAQAFERLGIDTGERTSKGTMSVGIKILADLPKEYVEKFPALKSYINYKKTAKLLSSYIKPLMKEYESRGYCRFAYKTTEVPCLTEDNYVYIKSKGLISIKDVEVDDLIWTQYGYKKVLWNNKKWSDEIYRLTLKNGTQLIGTGHHPVLLNTSNNLSDLSLSWSGISSTNVGDIVVCNSHSIENEDTLVSLPSYVCEGRKEVTIPKVMDKKLARLVGFLDGDGCLLSDRVKLAFNTKETEIIEYYISLMSEVFNIESGKLYHSPNSNSSDCCFFSTDIVRFLKSINVRQKLSDTVSEYIKNSSYDIWVEYLCGLFDSDGCLLKSKDLFVPSVKGIKSGMIKDVHQMLLFLGINSSLHIRPSSEGNKTQYEIRVTGDRGRGYFRDIIGKNVVHNMRRDRAINNKVSAFYDIHVNSVASVEKCLNVGDYVYDIEVEDVHEYIANGIVTHNTGRLACGKDGKNSFFSPINAQSLPKPHVKMEDVFDLGDRNLFSKKDNIIMGYKFVYSSYDEEGKHIVPEDSTYIGWVEGMDDDLNLRMAISPKMLEDSGDDEFLYCLDPKTSFIETKEFKYAPLFYVIEKLESGNTVHVKTPKGYRKITNYIHSGKKDAYKLVLKNGREIICSKEHSFMTDRGWVKLKDFTEDDSVIVDENMFSGVSWLPLYGYEDRYKINVHTGEMLGPDGHGSKFVRKCNPMIGSCGYVQYNVSKPGQKLKSRTRGYRVHRAILESYYESSKPFGFQVIDHIDSNKENNTIKNLQIGDHKYNLNKYSTKIKFKNGNNNSNAKHWEQYHDRVQKIIDISTRLGGFTKNLSRLISKKYGVSESYSYWVKRKMAIKENILLFKDSSNIECIINLNHQIDMVDIEVEDEHCFYCNSILTHNCSFDYAAEELRIAANLSREPNWVDAFVHGDDIHKRTAVAIWGEEHYNRDYRKMAKYANFSILYGASSHSLYADSRYGFKSLQEAEDFYDKYKKALPTLFQWQDRIIASAKRKGMLQTFFGRPRRLRSYYENRQIGFANRSAGNTSVQGVAGDILKMVMIKLWKVVFNSEEFKNDVSWRVAIHDEIGYTIRATKLMKALKVIKETQSVKLPEWPVEIITDPSVGWSMGRVYDFHMVEDDSELGYHFEPDLA